MLTQVLHKQFGFLNDGVVGEWSRGRRERERGRIYGQGIERVLSAGRKKLKQTFSERRAPRNEPFGKHRMRSNREWRSPEHLTRNAA